MARPKEKGRKAEAKRAIPKREAFVIQAAKDGVAPKLSKRKDTLGIQTPSGRIALESGGVVTPLGKAYFKAKGEKFRPRTSPGIDYLNATPQGRRTDTDNSRFVQTGRRFSCWIGIP